MSLIAGILAFAYFSGFSALSPTRLYWVMDNYDLPTHYLGWQYFRATSWLQWPTGSIPLYGYDAPGSIVLTDSIPLLALFFKVFSAWLPVNFQYFGIWVLACFLLQGWFAGKLLKRFSSSLLFCLGGSFLFATATVFVCRVFFHPALAGHWLVLAGVCLHLSPRFRPGRWTCLLLLAALVHAYLFVMVGVIWVADLAQRIYRREVNLKKILRVAAPTVGLVVFVMWAVGYFVPLAVEDMPSRSRANLLFAFWNGQNIYGGSWSKIVPTFPVDASTGDGFGYFGLGFLLLTGCAILLLPRRSATAKPQPHRSAWVSLTVVCMAMAICSFSNMVYFGDRLLFSFPLPPWLDHIYGVFRGIARFVWPLWYLILLACLRIVAIRLPARAGGWLVMLLAIVQGVDFIKPAQDYKRSFDVRTEWRSLLVSPAWPHLAHRYRRIVFILNGENSLPVSADSYLISLIPSYRNLAEFAAKHGMGINVAYMARVNVPKSIADRERRVQALARGEFESDTLYVTHNTDLHQRARCIAPGKAWAGTIDGVNLLAPGGNSLAVLAAIPAAPCPTR